MTSPPPRDSAPWTPPPWTVVAALVLVAANLRTLMTSLPPLAETIRGDLGLSSASMGVLTTLPVLCMGLLAPVANQVARRVGAASTVGAGATLVLLGVTLRGVGGGQVWSLYGGTLVAGAGIALAGTLLPGVVKAVFPPYRSGFGTGLVMFTMMSTASLASATAVPLANLLGGWSRSLLAWAPLAAVAVLAWLRVSRRVLGHTLPEQEPVDVSHALPWRSRTAWLIAGYLVCQSWQFYSSLAWIAPTYESHGWRATDAGLLLSVFAGTQFVSGLVAPTLLDRVRDGRILAVGATSLAGAGIAGIWLAPDLSPWLWAVLVGTGQGAAFALGLGLIVRFSVTPRDSARLTAMGFLLGYTVASAGPATMGAVQDVTGSYTVLWGLLTLVALPQLLLASRLRPGLTRVGEGVRRAPSGRSGA
jgi:CP family cyanate transporter-like MFS transporter